MDVYNCHNFQLNRQLGGSMPNCASNSGCSSRRSSRASAAGVYTSTPHTGVYSGPSSRRSSSGGPGSRRESLFLNPQDSLDSNPPLFNGAPGSSGGTFGGGLFQTIGSGVVGAASSSLSTIAPQRYRKTPAFRRPNQYFY